MQTQAKDFWKPFKPSACILKLKGSTTDEVFEEITTVLVKAKLLPKALREKAASAFVEREALASTGVGNCVAIPHVKLEGLEEPVFCLALAPEGIEWRSIDGSPAKIFFAVARPERASDNYDPDRHLESMRWIAAIARDADFRRFALAVSNRTELVELLREMSER